MADGSINAYRYMLRQKEGGGGGGGAEEEEEEEENGKKTAYAIILHTCPK